MISVKHFEYNTHLLNRMLRKGCYPPSLVFSWLLFSCPTWVQDKSMGPRSHTHQLIPSQTLGFIYIVHDPSDQLIRPILCVQAMSGKVLIRPISFYFIQDDGGMFKLNISPTSVLHPKITIRCHHLTLLYQEFGTETAVEEWLAINTKVHYHARLVARKISSCQTISRDTIGWTFIFLFSYRVDNSNRDIFEGKLDDRDLFS